MIVSLALWILLTDVTTNEIGLNSYFDLVPIPSHVHTGGVNKKRAIPFIQHSAPSSSLSDDH